MAAVNTRDFFGWYHEIPLISRLYLTAALGTSTACFFDLVSPLQLYYNYDLITQKGQYWRLITSFLYFGSFNLDFMFHMYFVVRYCRLLEEGSFRGRQADFLVMFFYGACLMVLSTICFATFSRIKFLGQPFTFMMVYLWARDPENSYIRMSFFGVLNFNAPYLPWVLLLFALMLGNPVELDLLGIAVGHSYYFLDCVYPKVAALRGWRWKKLLITPPILHYIFNTDVGFQLIDTDILNNQDGDAGMQGAVNNNQHNHLHQD